MSAPVPSQSAGRRGGIGDAAVGEPLLVVRDLRVEFPTPHGPALAVRGLTV